MKMIVTGKGGVGKTTIAAALAHAFARRGFSVLALDTDSIPNLAQSLGVPFEEAYSIVPLSKNEDLVEERTGARPGEGWGVLFSLTPKVDDLIDKYGVRVSDKISLVVVGSIDASKEGCLCPAIALAKAFLRHALLEKGRVVIVDSEAGTEVFGRGLAEKFDLMLCVAEPTAKSMLVSLRMVEMASELDIERSIVVINKVKDYEKAVRVFSRVFDERDVTFHVIRFEPYLTDIERNGWGVDKLPPDGVLLSDVDNLCHRICNMYKLKVRLDV